DSQTVCFLVEDSLVHGIVLKSEIDLGNLSSVVTYLGNTFKMRVRVDFGVYKEADYTPSRPGPHFAQETFPSTRCTLSYHGLQPGTVLATSKPWTDRAWVQGQFLQTVIWIGIAACLLAIVIGGI